ncbi:MAG: hypothetical protein J3Q66DRAFT_394094 [Benniella sp.]|nr:MAG: hypothetical protein J3Q66DRAFT_394094 [Benniella sp.]
MNPTTNTTPRLSDPPAPTTIMERKRAKTTAVVRTEVNVMDSSSTIARHSHQPSATQSLAVNTLLSKSQSYNPLPSPNQLQGVIVETMRTPDQAPDKESFMFDTHLGEARRVVDRNVFGGGLFGPEGSVEQCGIPWMLYRQRSQSVGAILPTTARRTEATTTGWTVSPSSRHKAISAGSTSLDHASTLIHIPSPTTTITATGAFDAFPTTGTDPISAGVSCSSDREDSFVYCAESEAESGTEEHASIGRTNSIRSGGKSLYSAYRRSVHITHGHSQQQQQKQCSYSQEQQPPHTECGSAAAPSTEGVGAGAVARVSETLSGPYPYLPLPLPCTDLTLSPNLSSSLTTTSSVRSDSITLTNSSVNSGHGCKDKEGGRAAAAGTSPSAKVTAAAAVVSPTSSELASCTFKSTLPKYQLHRTTGLRRCVFRVRHLLPCGRRMDTDTDTSSWKGTNASIPGITTTTTTTTANNSMAKHPNSNPLSYSLYFIYGIDDYNRQRKRWVIGRGFKGIDPKAFFSNERTYLYWIKFGLLLGSWR